MNKEALKVIMYSIRKRGDKDSKAYKITEYYHELTTGNLDDGGIVLARSKVLSIEKELRKWEKKHPLNNKATIMQPEESAIHLIDDLRDKGLLE